MPGLLHEIARMNRSRIIFFGIIAVALCIVAAGVIGNRTAAFLSRLPTSMPETVVVIATQPAPTVTPFPTDTPPPTLAPLSTATPGLIRGPDATAVLVPTPSRLEARPGQFSSASSGDGALCFVGEIINTGDQALARPEVSVVLYDSAGQVLANERGFATQDYVSPGQRVPVRVIFPSPPASWVRFQVLFNPKAATEVGLYTYSDLVSSALNFSHSSTMGYSISGMVKNIGAREARYVQAIVTLYGADGRVVGVGEDWADPDHLAPNESAVFKVTIYSTAAEPVSYRVQLIANAL
jgi:Protein of unknown function (DUF3426)